jgi:hypothetical protein
MARKSKRKKLQVAKEVRRLSRERLGPPPAEKTFADRRKKPPKHKKQLDEEVSY